MCATLRSLAAEAVSRESDPFMDRIIQQFEIAGDSPKIAAALRAGGIDATSTKIAILRRLSLGGATSVPAVP